MKYIFILLAALLFFPFVLAENHVVISEVLYHPNITASGGEFVELYNPTDLDIDIGGWKISTKTSASDATLPNDTIILAHHFYLVADRNFSIKKDYPEWPDADYEEDMTLADNDAGVALKNGDTVVDAVGWGNISGEFVEGEPAIEVAKAHSLERKMGFLDETGGNAIDTDNNKNDFLDRAVPEPQNSNNEETPADIGSLITVAATVTESGFEVVSVSIAEDDFEEPGTQILPNAGAAKHIRVSAQISGSPEEVLGDVGAKEFSLTKNGSNYTGAFDMDFYEAPGNYEVHITATQDGLTAENSITFEFLPLVAMFVDTTQLNFSAGRGAIADIIGDNDYLTANKPTIRNIGNTLLDAKISGTSLQGAGIIPVSSLSYSFGGSYAELTTSYASAALRLQPGSQSTQALSFRFEPPDTSASGNYIGSVMLAGLRST